jgi:hypothetical protein
MGRAANGRPGAGRETAEAPRGVALLAAERFGSRLERLYAASVPTVCGVPGRSVAPGWPGGRRQSSSAATAVVPGQRPNVYLSAS